MAHLMFIGSSIYYWEASEQMASRTWTTEAEAAAKERERKGFVAFISPSPHLSSLSLSLSLSLVLLPASPAYDAWYKNICPLNLALLTHKVIHLNHVRKV